ncbi:transposase [Leifsonia xyli]|uniref:transposase n=1 Tax=Leifsonia xyli TaxID=1575 RepID=UPI0009D65989
MDADRFAIRAALRGSPFPVLNNTQWAAISDLLPVPSGRRGRPSAEARLMIDGMLYRHRAGITWRELPMVFGTWRTVLGWQRRLTLDGTWALALGRLQALTSAGQPNTFPNP